MVSIANISTATISLPSLMSTTLAEVGDSSVTTPIHPQVPPVTSVNTLSKIVSAIVEGGSVVEPRVMPTYSNASLVFSFEGASAMGNIMEESPPSETAPAGTSVTTVMWLSHPSSIALPLGFSYRLWLLI